MGGMTREPGDVTGDAPNAFVLVELSEILDRTPEATDDGSTALADGSDIHTLEASTRPSGACLPNPDIDALLLAYLLDVDDPVRG